MANNHILCYFIKNIFFILLILFLQLHLIISIICLAVWHYSSYFGIFINCLVNWKILNCVDFWSIFFEELNFVEEFNYIVINFYHFCLLFEENKIIKINSLQTEMMMILDFSFDFNFILNYIFFYKTIMILFIILL